MTYVAAIEQMDAITKRERRMNGQRPDGVPRNLSEGAMMRMKARRAARGGH